METKLLRTFVALLLTTLATVTAWAADTVSPKVSNKTVTKMLLVARTSSRVQSLVFRGIVIKNNKKYFNKFITNH